VEIRKPTASTVFGNRNREMRKSILLATIVVLFLSGVVQAGVTGDPAADGWTLVGNSLEKGVYVTGSGNYGYDAYGAGFAVQAGSNLEISDGSLSWLAGDTVVAVGGVFQTITATEAGWTAFSGGSVNGLLPTVSPYSGPKLQAKFGTADASWYTSTAAPGAGNGVSGSDYGGERVQVRTSGYFQTGTPTVGQTEPWTWDLNSGQLLVLDKDTHIVWRQGTTDVNPEKEVARMIWIWDNTAHQVSSWELLLNVSLMDRLYPGFTGLLPAIGDPAIMTVQNHDSGLYTDALVSTTALAAAAPVPEPLTMATAFFAIGGLGTYIRRRRKAAAKL